MTNAAKRRIAIVTGASSAIGTELCARLLNIGYSVLAHHSTSRLVADDSNGSLTQARADFTQSEEIEGFVEKASAFCVEKEPDEIALFHCAGRTEEKHFESMALAETESVFRLNLFSFVALAQGLLPHMTRLANGRIIGLSSVGVKFAGSPTSSIYSAAKASMEAVTRSISKQYAAKGVLANCIQAGVTDTAFHRKAGRDLEQRAKLIPMRRAGRVEEIVAMMVFLAGPEATFISGQTIAVSGGE